MLSRLSAADRATLMYLQRHRPAAVTSFLKLVTYSATGYAWVVIALVMNALNFAGVIFLPNQTEFLHSLIATLIAWIVSKLLKRIVDRTRPIYSLDGLKPLIATPTCGSFPSGHSATVAALFFALLWIGHPLTPFIGLWAALVIFSRLYLGVHYLSDVVGGIAVGFFSSWLMIAYHL